MLYLLGLVKLALWDVPVDEERFKALTEQEWEVLFLTAQRQGLAAIVMDGLQKAGGQTWACRPLMKSWGVRTILGSEMRWERQLATARKISDLYHQHGIRTLLLKGLGLSRYYPIPKHREGSDIDVYLFGCYAEGNQLAKDELGAKVEIFSKKEDHIWLDGFSVDNHICFVYPSAPEERALDDYLKRLLDEAPLERLEDSNILLPPPEFNYLFLLHHSYAHFMREGMPLRQLTDMALFLQAEGDRLAWDSMESALERFGLRKFSDAVLSYISTRFEVKVPAHRDVNERLLERIESEIFGESHAVVYHTSALAHKWYIARTMWKNRWKYQVFHPAGFFGMIGNKLINRIKR